jgi:hypothetical protein
VLTCIGDLESSQERIHVGLVDHQQARHAQKVRLKEPIAIAEKEW